MSFTKSPLTFTAGAAISNKRLVALVVADGEVIHATEAYSTPVIGVADYAVADAELVAVRTLSEDGTLEVTASGAITAGDAVYCDDAGKIQALPAAAGTYCRVGFAIEAATADGDIVEVLCDASQTLTVVS